MCSFQKCLISWLNSRLKFLRKPFKDRIQGLQAGLIEDNWCQD